ncbi:hypothetical protein HK101_000603 [Irineochytrium annulatum]|nr:hypothetical protein HK101_000603 [Irineochytrium annulatum]
MSELSKRTVLVTIHEGRYFSSKNAKLYIQCRFNQEILTTDPVEHVPEPIWDTDLAWDIDAKPLGFLKSQRAKLKLICYEIDTQGRRVQVGYVMLDLRGAASVVRERDREPGPFWAPLVNVKNPLTVSRPELKVTFFIAQGAEVLSKGKERPIGVKGGGRARGGRQSPFEPIPIDRSSVSPRPLKPTAAPLTMTSSGIPVELSESGFYQIGFSGPHWLFNVTIAFGEHLHLLSDLEANAIKTRGADASTGFYFYYSFLGNNITTEVFKDLETPTFPAERLTFRLRSSEEDLRGFFRDMAALLIHLCKDGQVIGFAEIPLTSLMDMETLDSEAGAEEEATPVRSRKKCGPKVIENVYHLYNARQELPISVDSKMPGIGISIILCPDEETDVKEGNSRAVDGRSRQINARRQAGAPEVHQEESYPMDANVPAEKGRAALEEHDDGLEGVDFDATKDENHDGEPGLAGKAIDVPRSKVDFEPIKPPLPSKDTVPITMPAAVRPQESHSVGGSREQLNNAGSSLPLPVKSPRETAEKGPRTEQPYNTLSPALWHQYRFSIDLRTLIGFLPSGYAIFLRYSYVPFNTSTPITTHPAIHPTGASSGGMQTSEEKLQLPHSFTAFEFVMSEETLRRYLEGAPLVVSVLGRDSGGNEVELGSAGVELGTVLGRRRVPVRVGSPDGRRMEGFEVDDGGRGGAWIQSGEVVVPVIKNGRRVANLNVVLALEDFGVVEDERLMAETQAAALSAGDVDIGRRLAFGNGLASAPTAVAASKKRGTGPAAEPDRAVSPSTTSIHDTSEYRAALDLELWRREEAKKFRAHLKSVEADLLARLTDEFARRDSERARAVQARVDELSKLEERTRKLTIDLEMRERAVIRGEEEVTRGREQVERESARLQEEARMREERLSEEFRARVEVERARAVESEEARQRAAREREEMETRLRAVEREYDEFRRAVMEGKVVGPGAAAKETQAIQGVRDELARVVSKATEAERKAEKLLASKNKYKQLWCKALKQLSTAKRGWEAELQVRDEKERRQVEAIRLRMLAREEMETVKGEREGVRRLRREAERLMMGNSRSMKGKRVMDGDDDVTADEEGITDEDDRKLSGESSPNKVKLPKKNSKAKKENVPPRVLAEVERLAQEKDSLLQSGVYSREDKLIRELDARIQNLLSER